jgi:hypothetical protein
MSNLVTNSLTCEEYREYDFGGRVYRINSPVTLTIRDGGETHRVLDAEGIVHCVPKPGVAGCVLRWKDHTDAAPESYF